MTSHHRFSCRIDAFLNILMYFLPLSFLNSLLSLTSMTNQFTYSLMMKICRFSVVVVSAEHIVHLPSFIFVCVFFQFLLPAQMFKALGNYIENKMGKVHSSGDTRYSTYNEENHVGWWDRDCWGEATLSSTGWESLSEVMTFKLRLEC